MKLAARKSLRIVIEVALLGILVLVFVRVLNFSRLQEYVSLITFQVFAGVIVFQLAILFLHAVQWDLILREAGIGRGLWRTFWARVSGFALTYLTPSITFGGEPMRASLYKDAGMSYQTLYATVALDKYIELITKLPCIAVGFSFLVFLAHPSMALILISGCLFLAFSGFFIFLLVKVFAGGQFMVRFFSRLVSPLERLKPQVATRVTRAIAGFSDNLHAIVRRKRSFYLATLTGCAIAVIEVFQTWYILGVLHYPNLPDSFAIYATVLIQHAMAVLPGNLGSMEAAHLFIFNILGIGSTRSLVYTIILRLGQSTMVLLGIMNILFRRIEVRVRNAGRLPD